jgi:hypothetical protein
MLANQTQGLKPKHMLYNYKYLISLQLLGGWFVERGNPITLINSSLQSPQNSVQYPVGLSKSQLNEF